MSTRLSRLVSLASSNPPNTGQNRAFLQVQLLQIKKRIAEVWKDRGAKHGTTTVPELESALRSRRDVAPEVVQATLSVPRTDFVATSDRSRAQEDRALSIGKGQTISQPSLVAHMISELRLSARTARVLDVGCGSGYQAAILSRLAEKVYAVERIAELADAARRRLVLLGYDNIEVVPASDEVLGHPPAAPYDAIIVGASVPRIPPSLIDQLKLDGRLVVPVGSRRRQRVFTVTKRADDLEIRSGMECVFVPLIGPEAW